MKTILDIVEFISDNKIIELQEFKNFKVRVYVDNNNKRYIDCEDLTKYYQLMCACLPECFNFNVENIYINFPLITQIFNMDTNICHKLFINYKFLGENQHIELNLKKFKTIHYNNNDILCLKYDSTNTFLLYKNLCRDTSCTTSIGGLFSRKDSNFSQESENFRKTYNLIKTIPIIEINSNDK